MSAKLPLSLVVITRDAAADIAECMASASFAAETLVVDSGSRDDTVETARGRGARVIERDWMGFGPQKQLATREAAHDWVLCIDADERVSPDLARSIATLFDRGTPDACAYALARRNRFLGRWLAHGEGYPDWTVRLFDRRRARWSDDVVHERVIADGQIARLCSTRRPNRSTRTSPSRTVTRRFRLRSCTHAEAEWVRSISRCLRSHGSCVSTC